jgi:hypothetical protein
MIDYIRADFYRILRKKSLYITFAIFLVCYCFLVFMRSNGLTDDNIAVEGSLVFNLLSLAGGGVLFAALYGDDLSAKTLPAVIGFGRRKISIVVAKLIMAVIIYFLVFAMTLGVLHVVLTCFGLNASAEISTLVNSCLTYLLIALAYVAIASVVAFGTQKATLALVTYVVLATGFVGTMVGLLLSAGFIKDMVGDLSQYLITPLVGRLISEFSLIHLLEYAIYGGVFVALSAVIFQKKDLEF